MNRPGPRPALFTGRLDRFSTMRQFGGLNGFLLRTESDHDCYGAAHAGTALSAALGIAAARDKRGSDENVVAIIGDAALTNGSRRDPCDVRVLSVSHPCVMCHPV